MTIPSDSRRPPRGNPLIARLDAATEAIVGTRRLLILGRLISLGGWALFLGILALAAGRSGTIAYDAHAYWLAGWNFLHGLPLYTLNGPTDYGSFRYPPVFALLWAPGALLPDPVFSWIWELVELLSLRYLAGSWKRVGWCLWFLPAAIEVVQANVILLVGAAVWATLRGRGALGLPAAAVLKTGAVVALPYVWLRRPAARRALVVGAALVGAACLATYCLAPGAWPDYFAYLASQAQATSSGAALAIVPSPLTDFVLRFALASILLLAAIRWRSDTLIFVATILAVPVFWIASLAPLIVLPRLLPWSADESSAPGPASDVESEVRTP